MSTFAPDSRVRITKSILDKLPPPTTGQAFYRDTELRGFAVRVTATGHRAFVLEKRIDGRVRRITLGRCSELTVVQARQRAQQLLGQIAMGDDPVARKRRDRARSVTLREVYRDFLDARKTLRPTTRSDYDRAVYAIFADWADRPMHAITRAMVANRHRQLADDRGEQAANNYLRVLRALFSFAIDRYEDGTGEVVISQNPVLVLTRTRAWYPTERRQTVLKMHQLAAWYRAVESLREGEHPNSMGDTVADFLLFLLFTGLRRNEAATLQWAQVDLQDRVFTIQQTKSHRPLTLPIGDYLLAQLTRRLGAQQNAYVFAGREGHGRLVEPKRQISHVIEQSGHHFSCHDLRRTFITVAEYLNLSPYTIKRLVNHSTRGDVTAGYVISDIERLRIAVQSIEGHLLQAMGLRDPDPKLADMVALRRRWNGRDESIPAGASDTGTPSGPEPGAVTLQSRQKSVQQPG